MVHGDVAAEQLTERLAPDIEHHVGADERVSQRGRLLDVQALGIRAIAGVGQVQVARHSEQLARGDDALRSDLTLPAVEAYSVAVALRPDAMLPRLRRGEA